MPTSAGDPSGCSCEQLRHARRSPRLNSATASRSFWLFGTGAGAALFAGALLGVIVGTVIVAQTLYSSTKDHLYEFATLRAMGASNNYIFKVIISQAMLSAVFGFVIAALIGTAVVHVYREQRRCRS